MKRRISILAIPLLVLGTFAWVYAQTTAPAASEGGEKVVTKSGLTIVTVKRGEGSLAGDEVMVLYTGRLTNGKIFDSSANSGGQPLKFKLGEARVIKGWEEGLLGMHVGEKRTLIIPPELGYGKADHGEIPGNSTLEFDVELVGLQRPN
ncbi:FKBP-type peptidyl-prolyl cis-trans isomerase [soil metagenome]